MLPRDSHLFDCTRLKTSQGTGPAGQTLAGDFSFCFQCQMGSSLVLHRPIEITRVIGNLNSTCTTRAFVRTLISEWYVIALGTPDCSCDNCGRLPATSDWGTLCLPVAICFRSVRPAAPS